jgi:predicted nucleotidyltransferase component of viral defense system
MSFKAKIKQLALEKGISPQLVQQNYLIEVFLDKLSKSRYRENFIVKGGYLIGSLIGLNRRATMDLDTTIRELKLTESSLEEMALEIIAVGTDDSFVFRLNGVVPIRETDDYSGFRLKLLAEFEKIGVPVTVDVTTGDVITPAAISHSFSRLFGGENIQLSTYPLETVLAEKIETILSRGIASSRPRDLYDVAVISRLKGSEIQFPVLKTALEETQKKRDSNFVVGEYQRILSTIQQSEFQRQLWKKYQRQYSYASTLDYEEVLKVVEELIRKLL